VKKVELFITGSEGDIFIGEMDSNKNEAQEDEECEAANVKWSRQYKRYRLQQAYQESVHFVHSTMVILLICW
jgi:hypothetical protein